MSGSSYDETIQFRAGAEKEAAELLDEIHIGGVNVSELARTGLVEMLRRSLDEEDEIAVYERYTRGEIEEDVARILLGEKMDRMETEKAAFEAAMEQDTSAFLADTNGEWSPPPATSWYKFLDCDCEHHLWNTLAESLALTTTNVCKHELQTHVNLNTYAPEGSREQYLKQGSQRVLDHLNDAISSWTCVTVVPRPHGPNAGEESLKQELSEHLTSYRVVSLLDTPARRSIRRQVANHEYDVDVVGPPYLLYILLDNGIISKDEFCETTGGMIRTEGWTGYEVIKSAWASIPVDCSNFLKDEILPPWEPQVLSTDCEDNRYRDMVKLTVNVANRLPEEIG
jgi:hypothetical protein